jgi:predicted nucleic acid-binding Zn ribbon protein
VADDIFGDGNDNSKKKEVQPIKSKSKYLDQDWELSPEDQKDYKGFPSKQDATEHANEEPEIAFPCFALMYRLRKEFVDTKIDSVLADHNRYCTRFKRLINSEAISMKQRKGFVLLWAGLTAVDKAETRAEIMQFLEEDPLIEKDMIEKWDIIDLESKVDGAKASAGKAPPAASSKTAV